MTERKTTYCYKHKTPILSREETHKTFGGLIYESDFETDYGGKNYKRSQVASRIVTDRNFDKQCKTNTKIRERQKKHE